MRALAALAAPLAAAACAALMQGTQDVHGTPRVLPDGRIAETFLVDDVDDGAPQLPATVAYAARLQTAAGLVDFWHVWVRGMRDTLLTSTPAEMPPDEAMRQAREAAWSLAREIVLRTRCRCDTLRVCPERPRGPACT